MFFEGSLQDGISTALQQSRQVVCFVTDGSSESQQWESEFLKDESIRPGLESQSVVLRLSAGSEEAGYLEALFPVPKKPTIVVIQNGQLKEYIASGTSKEEFIRRLSKTTQLGVTQNQPSSSSASRAAAANPPPVQHSAPARSNDGLYDDTQPTATPASSSAHAQGAGPTPTEEEQRPKAEKKDKGKARAEAEDDRRESAEDDPPHKDTIS
ncbi:hypothetical protein NUW58_g9367 [Xylaria curta]|uniref:Uncharacterized protein n=1 Tax=Xylaria curta TaxID=42375 RepID=A0ACC1MYB3_9PEZI|nr:hypothetical protein NUW58_g9367 [Xylaria curta]